jgi:predicted nucleic acid-binding Zn ribbon protein
MERVLNHCALCGKPIEPEDEYCADCASKQEPCPICGKVICECEVAGGD